MTNQNLPVNQTASNADVFIKRIEGILLPIAENAIIAACPTLGLPIIKQISEAIETAFANSIIKMVETGVTFAIVDGQVSSEENNLSLDQTNILNDEKSGDQNALIQDEEKFEHDQDSLGSDDGSAVP